MTLNAFSIGPSWPAHWLIRRGSETFHYLRVAYKVISDFLLGSLRPIEQLKYFGLPILFDSFGSGVDSARFGFSSSSLVDIGFLIFSLH